MGALQAVLPPCMLTPALPLRTLVASCALAALFACGGSSSDTSGTGSSQSSTAGTGTGGGTLTSPATTSPTASGTGTPSTSGTTGTSTPSSPSPAASPLCAAAASLPSASGDLRARLNAAFLVASSSEGFQPPSGTDQLAFEHAFSTLLSGAVADGRSALNALGFEVTMFHPTSGDAWLVVEERAPHHGGGTFAVNLAPARDLWLEAPHADSDTGTLAEAVDHAIRLGARALLITGANRCADAAYTRCDGTTAVCGGHLRISDAAHSPDNDFTAAHRALRDTYPSALAISVHGMETDGTEAAVVSDGSTGKRTSSISIPLRDAINQQLTGTQRAWSCNDSKDDGNYRALCGTTNVQGRIDNQSADACFSFTSQSLGHFLHIEQSSAMRGVSSGTGSANGSPEVLFQALKQTVPCALPGNGDGCPQVPVSCP